jgi:hypothetical protein
VIKAVVAPHAVVKVTFERMVNDATPGRVGRAKSINPVERFASLGAIAIGYSYDGGSIEALPKHRKTDCITTAPAINDMEMVTITPMA